MTLEHHASAKKRKRRDSDANHDIPEVGLINLQMNTLRRYKRHFKLQTKPGLNKAQLAESLQRHFSGITVVEKEALAYFIYMVKMKKNRIDMKEGNNGGNGNEYSSSSSTQRQKSS